MKAALALGIVIVFGVVGFLIADPFYDAAARSLCAAHAADRGLELVEARGSPEGRRGFRSFPDYVCEFRDPGGATVFVDENDGVIEPTWTYRALRVLGWLSWVLGVALGVGVAAALGLLKRDSS